MLSFLKVTKWSVELRGKPKPLVQARNLQILTVFSVMLGKSRRTPTLGQRFFWARNFFNPR